MVVVAFGAGIRALRFKRAWRQVDLARRARVSERTIGRVESGQLEALTVGALRRAAEASGATISIGLRWHGGDLERLVNAGHARMHESIARVLHAIGGWRIVPEVSYSIWGERGVIDVLAWHEASRALLVVELKTEIVDPSGLVAQVDRYRRIARTVAADRGWRPSSVSTWVVVADSRLNRARLARHATMLRSAFPSDGRTVRAWLRRPRGAIDCLSFLRDGEGRHAAAGARRVRARTKARSSGPA